MSSCQTVLLRVFVPSGHFNLTLVYFVPQNLYQLLWRVFGNNLSELGAVIFHHTDAFNDEVVDLPTAAFIGQSIDIRKKQSGDIFSQERYFLKNNIVRSQATFACSSL